MKKLIKGLIITLLVLVLIVVALVVGLVIAISSNVDEFDASKIDTNYTTNDVLKENLNYALDNLGEEYALDVLLDEKEINTLLYAVAKENINEKYNPVSGETSEELYIFTVPVTSGLEVNVKHMYATVDDDTVTVNLTGEAFGFVKTRIYFTFKVEATETEYILNISALKCGKLNLIAGVFKNSLKTAGVDTTVNDKFKEMEFPFELDINSVSLKANKDEFSNWVKSLLSKKEDEEEKEDDSEDSNVMTDTLIDLLLSSKYNFLSLGVLKDGEFGFSIDLSKLKVNAEDIMVPEFITTPFDKTTFIKSKTQGLVIDMLSTTDKSITFTEDEISKVVYLATEEYKDFVVDEELMEGVNFHFDVQGLLFDIEEEGKHLTIKVILNINGLKTIGTYRGEMVQVSDAVVDVKMEDTLKLGYELEISSDFLKGMLYDAFSKQDFITFNKETNTFTITTDLFQKFMSEADTDMPFAVSKLTFDTDVLKVGIGYTNLATEALIQTTKELIKNTLSSEFIDLTNFDSDDESVQNLVSALENARSSLDEDDTLTEEQVEELTGAINGLSEDDRNEFYSQLQEQSGSSELESLYNQLFGGND